MINYKKHTKQLNQKFKWRKKLIFKKTTVQYFLGTFYLNLILIDGKYGICVSFYFRKE